MANTITFSMIKPDAVASGHSGAILAQIEAAGFHILALKLLRLSETRAQEFYAVHAQRPFYRDLCAYMSSGPVVAMVLGRADAVAAFRKLIGATDPKEADAGTIRHQYARSVEANAIHGADSDDNAVREANFFFSTLEYPAPLRATT